MKLVNPISSQPRFIASVLSWFSAKSTEQERRAKGGDGPPEKRDVGRLAVCKIAVQSEGDTRTNAMSASLGLAPGLLIRAPFLCGHLSRFK